MRVRVRDNTRKTTKVNLRQQAVRQALYENANSVFQFGLCDCVKFAASGMKHITGTDPTEALQYQSEDEAAEILKRYGGMAGLVTAFLGAPCDRALLEDGDPVMIQWPGLGDVMGMMVNNRVLVKTAKGTVPVNTNRIIKGWHI
jgi:hypothetical protein|tara:strand:- start:607 stop:1038 length:432 start_codon:yes stop_codon:yes gene_type:complete